MAFDVIEQLIRSQRKSRQRSRLEIPPPVSQARKSREAVEGLRVLLHEGFFAASEIFHKFIGRNWFHAPAPYRCRSK